MLQDNMYVPREPIRAFKRTANEQDVPEWARALEEEETCNALGESYPGYYIADFRAFFGELEWMAPHEFFDVLREVGESTFDEGELLERKRKLEMESVILESVYNKLTALMRYEEEEESGNVLMKVDEVIEKRNQRRKPIEST